MTRRIKFLTEQYSKCWKFLNETKWHVVFSLAFFAVVFLFGFVYPYLFRDEILKFIEKLMIMFEGKGTFETIGLIFFNNLKASFFAMVLGIGIGIFPLVTLIINGYLLGFVAREAVAIGGLSVMWQLFPHGIFELPAIMFSIGIGIKIGLDMFYGNIREKIRYNLTEGMRFFIFIILPLLVIAAIIEGLLIAIVG
jgi:stage II sporulation protein M